MLTRFLDLIARGIETGDLSRFILMLVAAALLVYLTISKNASTEVSAFIWTIIGFYFGAQSRSAIPSTGGAGVGH
jgi:hypothetical protein